MSVGKSKSKTTSSQTQQQSGTNGPDAVTQGRVGEIYGAAQNAANAGVPTSVSGAGNYYGSQMDYGNQGNAALNGDAAAAAKYMNPYQQQVLDAATKQFGVQNQMTEQQMNDSATRAGAFGGSRHGVATGVALGENARNQSAQYAGLLSSGYADAMGRASNAANMGYNAAGANANLGMTAGNPDLWRMNVLKQGFSGTPYGTTYASQGSGSGRGNSSGYNFAAGGK